MPGLEDSSPRLAPINPASLIGKAEAVVEPNAVSALTNAFRNGFITADDIHERVGQNAQARKKLELQLNTEAASPEAQAARAAGLGASTATAKLGSAQAGAALPMVQPAANLATMQLEKAQAYEKYPAAAFFEKFAPALGLEVPTTPDGKTDYAKMARVGSQLAAWQTDKMLAKEEEKNIETVANADGTGYISRTKSGIPLTPEQVKAVQDRANKPFQMMQPGTATVAPAPVAPAPAAPVVTTAQLSTGAVQSTALPNAENPDQPEVTVSPTPAQPAGAPAVATVSAKPQHAPPGTLIPGVGVSLGDPKAKDLQNKAPTEAQQRAELALARFSQSNDMFKSLKDAGYDPTSIGSWMGNFLPEVLKSGDRKAYNAAVDAWSQGLLRLESGAAISRQEKTWYERAFFPAVNDPPAVVESKAAMRRDVEKMVSEIAQAGSVDSPESAAQTARLAENARKIYQQAGANLTGATPGAGAATGNSRGAGWGAPIEFNGQRVQKGPDGRYYPAQ